MTKVSVLEDAGRTLPSSWSLSATNSAWNHRAMCDRLGGIEKVRGEAHPQIGGRSTPRIWNGGVTAALLAAS